MIENNGNMPLQLDWLLGRNSVSKMADLLTELISESDLVSKMADLLTEWVFEGDLVSKMAVLLTELVFEIDLVSKTPDLLTEMVFESDLVSKMHHLLTEKGARRSRCAFVPHTLNAPNGPEGIERQIGCAKWSTQKHTLNK